MIVFPQIYQEGKLKTSKGNFEKNLYWRLRKARQNFENGAEWIHVIDLDGALSGQTKNAMTIKKIIETSNCKIQLGGEQEHFLK